MLSFPAHPDARSYAQYGGAPNGRSNFHRLFVPYRQFQIAMLRAPDKLALVSPFDDRYSFAELDKLIRDLASGMRNLGVQPGEAVCARIGNHWMQVPWFLALMRLGAVFMSISKYLTPVEADYQLDQARPRLIVGEGGVDFDDLIAAASDDPVAPHADEWAPSHIRFSSGTTGKPKMMLVNQRANAANAKVIEDVMRLDEQDRHLLVGPLSHAGLHYALPTLNVGGTVFIKEAFDKATFWADCRRHGITSSMVVPTMLATALDYEGDAPTLQKVVSLGASLAPTIKRKLLARFPHLGLYELYGSSEGGSTTWLLPHDQLRKPSSCGRAYGGQEILVADDAGDRVPAGTIGNVYVRGPMAVTAYVGEVPPPAIPEALQREGWVTAGDVGFLDEEGDLTIADRRVDLILSGGLNVYPAEVEAVLLGVAGIIDVAVVGLPDDRWGQVVSAFYVGDVSEAAALAACRQELASYKVPRNMTRVDALPRTSSGKTSRRMVKEMFSKA
ncbi:class I adenylate-forming enzyme family protein [Sphingomonas profundi]|uniref:class I adenylate-forming enzyme family protein n=1 Tax=Alterirhizorhabdus profundi TaxID=2681549 RepID=UPI0012E93C34|nr:AMP-binding protein [Sphingomonas profundi]